MREHRWRLAWLCINARIGRRAHFGSCGCRTLALANRYDGIDLSDEACRLVVLAGLPVGMHLQERFLHESVKALVVLIERIGTRLTQGADRATRNSADYAAVLMLGRDLANFCAQPGVQAASHPEIRAELCFRLGDGLAAGAARWRCARATSIPSTPLWHRHVNPARKVDKPRRLPSTRRAVADKRLAETVPDPAARERREGRCRPRRFHRWS